MISLHPGRTTQSYLKYIHASFSLYYSFPEGNFGSLQRDYLLPEENFGSLEKIFSLSKGNLGFLERDYSLPKGEMTLDKVLRSPQGKPNTRSRFDGVIHFLENCELNCLLTSSV